MKQNSIIIEHKELDLIKSQGMIRRILLDIHTKPKDREEAERLLLRINKALDQSGQVGRSKK